MASYKISFKRSAEKELRGISQPYLSKIIEKIKKLSEDPRLPASEILKGEEAYYKIRQNDYRIVYEIRDADKEVVIIKIGHRRDVYRF